MLINKSYLDCHEIDGQLVYLDPPFFTKLKWTLNLGQRVQFNDQFGCMEEYINTCILPAAQKAHDCLLDSGILVIHCDHNADAYIRIAVEQIFPVLINVVTWRRTKSHNAVKRQMGNITDTIFFFAKTRNYMFNVFRRQRSLTELVRAFPYVDERGRYSLKTAAASHYAPTRRYKFAGFNPPNGWKFTRKKIHELVADDRIIVKPHGVYVKYYRCGDPPLQNLWTDINRQARDVRYYPTQKPISLLERIISITTDPGDLVLDFFGGSGTTLIAAKNLHRRAVAYEISPAACRIAAQRCGLNLADVEGYPHTIAQIESLGDVEYQDLILAHMNGQWENDEMARLPNGKTITFNPNTAGDIIVRRGSESGPGLTTGQILSKKWKLF